MPLYIRAVFPINESPGLVQGVRVTVKVTCYGFKVVFFVIFVVVIVGFDPNTIPSTNPIPYVYHTG